MIDDLKNFIKKEISECSGVYDTEIQAIRAFSRQQALQEILIYLLELKIESRSA